jgi:ribonuclease P protein component
LTAFVLQTEAPAVRAGFVAGRKVGNAVHRNRAKRRLREAFRMLKARIVSGTHVVFVAKPPCSARQTPEVFEEMEKLLHRARVL